MQKFHVTVVVLTVLILAGCGKSKQEKAAQLEHQREIAARATAKAEEDAAQLAQAEAQRMAAVRAEQAAVVEAQQVAKLKEKIANTLRDPMSAQFRNLQVTASKSALCGEINAKNAFGGYVGFRRFVASDDESAIEGERKADRTDDLMSRISYKLAASKVGCPTSDA